MNNETLCCDQIHALLLKETGLMEGVEADGCYLFSKDATEILFIDTPYGTVKNIHEYYKHIYTYRLDKILAKLPEWVFASCKHDALRRLGVDYNSEIGRTILSRMYEISIFRVGQAAANAAAKLLHLLWKEGLI